MHFPTSEGVNERTDERVAQYFNSVFLAVFDHGEMAMRCAWIHRESRILRHNDETSVLMQVFQRLRDSIGWRGTMLVASGIYLLIVLSGILQKPFAPKEVSQQKPFAPKEVSLTPGEV